MDENQLEEFKELGSAAQIRSEAKFKEAALLYLSGHDAKEIAKAVGFKPDYVSKIVLRHPKFLALLKEVSEKDLSKELIKARKKISNLVDLSYAALEYQLKEKKSLEGVRIVFEQLGGNRREEKPQEAQQQGGITVVMPGATVEQKPPDIQVNVSQEKESGAV